MQWLFFVFILCAVVAIPIHFASVEHGKLERKHGKEAGFKIGEIYGRVSAYLLSASLIGLWFSPQPRFTVPVLRRAFLVVPEINFVIPIVHIILFLLFLVTAFLLFGAVTSLTLRVSTTHHPDHIVTTGAYSRVRHPQYLGFILMHIGFSFLMSAVFAMIATPLILLMLYSFARKEEVELAQEFGGEGYDAYRRKVPILIPGFHARRARTL